MAIAKLQNPTVIQNFRTESDSVTIRIRKYSPGKADMTFSRRLKRYLSLSLVSVLFFAQMAVAAYVCPVQTGAFSFPAAALAVPDDGQLPTQPGSAIAVVPDCQGMNRAAMDADSPSLCHASCNSAGQSDQTSTVKLPTVTFSSLPFVWVPTLPVAGQAPVVPVSTLRSVAAPRPLSVLYCCFRI